jgi:hypothetical protein
VPEPSRQHNWLDWIPVVCFLLALAAVAIVYFTLPGNTTAAAFERLTVVVGYVTLMLLFFFALMVLFALARGRIDLSQLISEPNSGGASISRFQLLLFTFVIAFSLFLMVVSSYSKPPMRFPAVPPEILTLLGISASTYAVSKGIQASNPGMTKKATGSTKTIVQDKATGKTTTTEHNPTTGETTTTVHDPAAGQTTTSVQTSPGTQPPSTV